MVHVTQIMSGKNGWKFSQKVGGMSKSSGTEQEWVISPRRCTCIFIVAIVSVQSSCSNFSRLDLCGTEGVLDIAK